MDFNKTLKDSEASVQHTLSSQSGWSLSKYGNPGLRVNAGTFSIRRMDLKKNYQIFHLSSYNDNSWQISTIKTDCCPCVW